MSANLLWKLSISETIVLFNCALKHPKTIHLRKKEFSGLNTFMKIIDKMRQFDFVEFVANDIVRSSLVKSYIIERDKQGL